MRTHRRPTARRSRNFHNASAHPYRRLLADPQNAMSFLLSIRPAAPGSEVDALTNAVRSYSPSQAETFKIALYASFNSSVENRSPLCSQARTAVIALQSPGAL